VQSIDWQLNKQMARNKIRCISGEWISIVHPGMMKPQGKSLLRTAIAV
jgi:hypothetical protein